MVGNAMTDVIGYLLASATGAVLLLVTGAIVWRIMFGSKTDIGLLETYENRRKKHEREQTVMDKDARQHTREAEDAAHAAAQQLHVLMESEKPPEGAAFIAQELVSATAKDVEEMKQTLAVVQDALARIENVVVK